MQLWTAAAGAKELQIVEPEPKQLWTAGIGAKNYRWWSRSPNIYGRLEPGPKIVDGGAGAQTITNGWNQDQKFTDGRVGA